MGRCSVKTCTYDVNNSLFTLPKDPEIGLKWLNFLVSSGKEVHDNVEYRICEAHFLPSEIKMCKTVKKLQAGVVPSILKLELIEMQQRSCVVCGYVSPLRKPTKQRIFRELFKFLSPDDPKFDKWIENMNLTPDDINYKTKICSKHFSDEMFLKSSMKRKRLELAKAIPTEHPKPLPKGSERIATRSNNENKKKKQSVDTSDHESEAETLSVSSDNSLLEVVQSPSRKSKRKLPPKAVSPCPKKKIKPQSMTKPQKKIPIETTKFRIVSVASNASVPQRQETVLLPQKRDTVPIQAYVAIAKENKTLKEMISRFMKEADKIEKTMHCWAELFHSFTDADATKTTTDPYIEEYEKDIAQREKVSAPVQMLNRNQDNNQRIQFYAPKPTSNGEHHLTANKNLSSKIVASKPPTEPQAIPSNNFISCPPSIVTTTDGSSFIILNYAVNQDPIPENPELSLLIPSPTPTTSSTTPITAPTVQAPAYDRVAGSMYCEDFEKLLPTEFVLKPLKESELIECCYDDDVQDVTPTPPSIDLT